MKFYEVGGAVRDSILGVETKDVDFAVEAPSFEAMEQGLIELGFRIFQSKPEYLTVRAQVPKDSPLRKRTRDADFVLCRKDGPTKDGRRPEYVEPGTIIDDLARRDFTVNAIARDPETDELIDPHKGAEDLKAGLLRFVGDARARVAEDGLRVLRGYRFMITKGLIPTRETYEALTSGLAATMMMSVSVERIREELVKMFNQNTLVTIQTISQMPFNLRGAIFRDGLKLEPTLKKG